MKGMSLAVVVAGVIMASPVASFAMDHQGARYTLSFTQNYTPSVWTSEDGYAARMKDKLLFSSKNTLLGFMELYNEPRDAKREQRSVMRGMGRGLVNMLGDTIGGAAQLITFPVTAVDIALPEGGTDVL